MRFPTAGTSLHEISYKELAIRFTFLKRFSMLATGSLLAAGTAAVALTATDAPGTLEKLAITVYCC